MQTKSVNGQTSPFYGGTSCLRAPGSLINNTMFGVIVTFLSYLLYQVFDQDDLPTTCRLDSKWNVDPIKTACFIRDKKICNFQLCEN